MENPIMTTKRSSLPTILTTVLAGALALALIAVALLGASPVYAQTVSIGLTSNEVEGLLFMLEEEKLARDVYQTLDEQWGLNVFHHISRAEQTHLAAVATILEQYGFDTSSADGELGVFDNQDLQALYDQLVSTGSQSMADALAVGIVIEEIDILDLEERLAATENADVQRVYTSLLRGSNNHLRAFVSNMERETGEPVSPEYLSQEAFDEIMVGSSGRNDFGQARSGRGNRSSKGRHGAGSGTISGQS
jgi:hypothetical protein